MTQMEKLERKLKAERFVNRMLHQKLTQLLTQNFRLRQLLFGVKEKSHV